MASGTGMSVFVTTAIMSALLVSSCSSSSEPEVVPVEQISGSTGTAPGLAWTVTPEGLGSAGSQFRDPRQGSTSDSGESGVVTDGTVLVTLMGTPTDLDFEQAEFVGIDARDGSVAWTAPADDIEACGAVFVDGSLVCFTAGTGSTSAISSFDSTTGEVTTRDSGRQLGGIATDGQSVFTFSDVDDAGSVSVSAGTATDLAATWTASFDRRSSMADGYSHSTLRIAGGVGLYDGAESAFTFDLNSGEQLWSRRSTDCTRPIGLSSDGTARVTYFECGSSNVVRSEILAADGSTVATSDSDVAQQPTFDEPDTSGLVLLGDGAFSSGSTEPTWTNPALRRQLPEGAHSDTAVGDRMASYLGSVGTVQAIAGSVVLTSDPDGGSETAIDLATGETLWTSQASDSPADISEVGALDGTAATLFGPNTFRSIDVRSGQELWSIPVSNFDDAGEYIDAWPTLDTTGDQLIFARSASLSLLRNSGT